MELLSYSFMVKANCASIEEDWQETQSAAFVTFLVAVNSVQCLLCLMSLSLNCLSFVALGRDASDSSLVATLQSLAVVDCVYVLINTLDNLCHTLEAATLADGSAWLFTVSAYAHPLVWGTRVTYICAHNWLTLLMSAVRYAKIRWPIRGNLLFTRRRTLRCIGLVCAAAHCLCAVRGLEVSTKVFDNCPDGRRRMVIFRTMLFPAYTMLANFGLQTLVPMLAAMAICALSLRTMRSRPRALQGHLSGHRSWRRRQHGTRTVSALLYLYLLCQIPMLLYGVVVLLPLSSSQYITLDLVANVVSSLDGSCNFFIYVVTNPRFKRNALQLLRVWQTAATGRVGTTESTSRTEQIFVTRL